MTHGTLVTLYKPSAAQIEHLLTLPAKSPAVVAVDNSPVADRALYARLAEGGVDVIANHNRGGIAGAFNAGVEFLIGRGCDVFFIFDQDSYVPDDYFDRMLAGCARVGDSRFLVGPRIFNRNFQRDLPLFTVRRWSAQITPIHGGAHGLLSCSVIISSGTAISLDAYRALGRFREDFFIDHVDAEYCMRAQAHGVPVCVNADVSLPHELGSPSAQQHWPRVEIFDQSPLRHYYAARNCILVARDYWRRYPAMLLINLITLKHVAFVLLHARNKRLKLKAIYCGVTDGLRGRYGRV
ncbi:MULTISPECIES: glycosyltransferase family 2 protein [Burkholderia]|uniref:Glycosyl transferase 2 family protein n=1 Tax=Burkholderia cepacia TaxID=292 RepID=A0AA89CM05_BURCE|nr:MULTISPECIES: glycosyltransferase family 2 protein [Burkholderia]AOI80436.1 rhamnosyltransferase [Burkholderia sp. NRF60-BP8]KGC06403.1 glycosyl transferase 2 family protein [Burkholderia cepacia]KVA17233.1 rhamnosyltransferase [Burkholderia sp. NRF60-BP8]KVH54846.1 rhamnosyltransferase [Burkholderia sp. MSMB1072]KVL09959.1 rhamnosyltransferase [Burkholderia sp. MSMB1826]